jgi:hypothetical protein
MTNKKEKVRDQSYFEVLDAFFGGLEASLVAWRTSMQIQLTPQ